MELLAAMKDMKANKKAFQRSDWSRRPLPEAVLAYSSFDSRHLIWLWLHLTHMLELPGNDQMQTEFNNQISLMQEKLEKKLPSKSRR